MVYLDQKRDIEEKLGQEINLDKIQKITSLNDIPESLAEKCRRLNGTFLKECLISYYVTEDNHKYLRFFVACAINRGARISDWLRGRVLIPHYNIGRLINTPLEEIYKNIDMDYSTIIAPKAGRLTFNGVFVKAEPEATYKSPSVEGFDPYHEKNVTQEVNPDHKSIWFRRWIANSMFFYLPAGEPSDTCLKEKLITFAPYSGWTVDAKAAYEGLMKEKKLGQWGKPNVPGYVGDDSFYV